MLTNYNGITNTYDAWGNILSITGSMATTLGAVNPFRYRGYYYDTETGFYYLQSRYYDPKVGRFLNADGIIGANGGIIGYNMFAYCSNNPVMCVDPTGYAVKLLDTAGTSVAGLAEGSIIARGGGVRRVKAKQTDPTLNTLVNNQPDFTDEYIGWFPIKSNGCEAIAIHNARVLLGCPSSLSQTVSDVESFLLFCGAIGILPGQLTDILDFYGMSYSVSNIHEMTQEGVYIVSYWSKFPIIHTVAVQYDGTTYTTYNIAKGGQDRVYTGHPHEYTGDGWLAVIYLGERG